MSKPCASLWISNIFLLYIDIWKYIYMKIFFLEKQVIKSEENDFSVKEGEKKFLHISCELWPSTLQHTSSSPLPHLSSYLSRLCINTFWINITKHKKISKKSHLFIFQENVFLHSQCTLCLNLKTNWSWLYQSSYIYFALSGTQTLPT